MCGGATVTWFVDAHVHYHERFGWRRFLLAAFDNLDRWIAETGASGDCAGCLCFVDQFDGVGPDELRSAVESGDSTLLPTGCTLHATDEATACRIERPDGAPLILVAGRQVATREGLEVLALSCGARIHDGLELEETIDAVQAASALTVIPWGFGKWWGARGRKVSRALEQQRDHPVYVGDNGNRLESGSGPAGLAVGVRPVLAGSDPLPLDHHRNRVLSYGFRIDGELDPDRPGASLRTRIAALPETPITLGRRARLLRFVTDQLHMQWQVRRRRIASSRKEPMA
jgi:hypothetical protein